MGNSTETVRPSPLVAGVTDWEEAWGMDVAAKAGHIWGYLGVAIKIEFI
jgi:hypothetical protein